MSNLSLYPKFYHKKPHELSQHKSSQTQPKSSNQIDDVYKVWRKIIIRNVFACWAIVQRLLNPPFAPPSLALPLLPLLPPLASLPRPPSLDNVYKVWRKIITKIVHGNGGKATDGGGNGGQTNTRGAWKSRGWSK